MTDVLLIICEALLAVIVLYTGFYLLTHRNRKFLLFDPTSEPSLKIIMTIWGSLLIILGLLTILAIFIIKKYRFYFNYPSFRCDCRSFSLIYYVDLL